MPFIKSIRSGRVGARPASNLINYSSRYMTRDSSLSRAFRFQEVAETKEGSRMAKFCNKCGSPVSGVFCVKCGADTRLAATPAQPVAVTEPPPSVPSLQQPVVSTPTQSEPGHAKFCNKCGAPSSGTAFCNKCGAHLGSVVDQAPQMAAAPVAPSPLPPPVPAQAQPMPGSQVQAKGSPLTKILIGFAVVVITVGALAAGGVYYVVYRVKQKVHEVAREVPGLGSSSDSGSGSNNNSVLGSISKMVSGSSDNNSNSSGGGTSNGGISGDPCRLLSKEEVGRAIGVEIVATQSSDGGCSYLAKGDSGDMTAKHMAGMMGARGADAKTQKMVQDFAGGMAKAFQSEGHQETSDSNGNVPVFGFGVDNNSAEMQMRLNAKTLATLGSQQGVPGIGDQAFDEAGAMLMVRKGDKLIRIMYSTCPCNLDAIKPLAKMLADRL